MNKDAPFKRTVFSQSMPSLAEHAKNEGEKILLWNATDEEFDLCRRIVTRIKDMANERQLPLEETTCMMDLVCVHLNTCPLELYQLLITSDEDFTHDVLGIMSHIYRKNGILMNDFKPRNAKKGN